MIVEKVLETKAANARQYPVNANRASEMGHPCVRYLVLNRTRWQEKSLPNARLQMIFDMGRMVEDLVSQDLREAGFRIVEQQRPFSWPEYQITGSIDFKLAIDGQVYPVEVKSAAPNPFASINSAQDMLRHKYLYMRKYPAQLTLYLIMDNKERGLFLFKNKSTGEMKEIWLDLDMEFAESLVQKAEKVNWYVAQGTLPDPIDYAEDICGECPFVHICLPDRIGKEVEVPDDGQLLELVTRYHELKAMAKEYDEVNDRINKLVEGREKILVGDYFIQGKYIERATYDIPDEVKAQYKGTAKSWRKQIIPIQKGVVNATV
jgi:CRISPR/Cas system-associated exonuclease Cas4 (RecB family)